MSVTPFTETLDLAQGFVDPKVHTVDTVDMRLSVSTQDMHTDAS